MAQNWRCGLGELDLVLMKGPVLVFCEVKTRRAGGLGGPFDAVNWKKQGKLRALAAAFLASRSIACDDIRFDVASVISGETGPPSVHVFEAAF